jgi:hypothetical protein
VSELLGLWKGAGLLFNECARCCPLNQFAVNQAVLYACLRRSVCDTPPSLLFQHSGCVLLRLSMT